MIANKQYSPRSFKQFLNDTDQDYLARLTTIKLFDPSWTAQWSRASQQHFAKTFYHLRGHFHDFLWIMGNAAPDSLRKDMILANIAEEFGDNGHSHEMLYYRFAKALGINDPVREMVQQPSPYAFVEAFNQGHHAWLYDHDWVSQQAAFSAYERLDNLDYPALLRLAESFGLSAHERVFFTLHARVSHFDVTEHHLNRDWPTQPDLIIAGFDFIYRHQQHMWRQLSQIMEVYANAHPA